MESYRDPFTLEGVPKIDRVVVVSWNTIDHIDNADGDENTFGEYDDHAHVEDTDDHNEILKKYSLS